MSKKLLFDSSTQDTPDTNVKVLASNYVSNGEKFSLSTNVDFNAGEYIEARITADPNKSETFNIISFGKDIHAWASGTTRLHIYYNYAANILLIDFNTIGGGAGTAARPKIPGSTITFKLSKEGLFLNDVLAINPNYTNLTVKFFQELTALRSIEIGSLQGPAYPYATYEYIIVGRMI